MGSFLRFYWTMRPAEEQSSLCFWHLIGVLIYRGRHLSARNSRSASPVETDHPLATYYYNMNLSAISPGNFDKITR
jgi:hypothetical protein